MTARFFLVLAIGFVIGGPLSFIWFAFDEAYWWIPMAFVTWLAAILLPEWRGSQTAPYRPHRHHRRRR